MPIKYVVSSFLISVTGFEKQNNKYSGQNLYMILIKWTQVVIKKIKLEKIIPLQISKKTKRRKFLLMKRSKYYFVQKISSNSN
jgi:hypothetical protein